ncbi:MAG: Uma2 family endonuclease [bacterium]|nr:Uma2 family endonuclease [bacterium]
MTILITRKDYEALPEGMPMELCDGLLVKQPSPRYGHQRIQSVILKRLKSLLPAAVVLAGPVDVLIDELNVFVPDIVVLSETLDDDASYVGTPLLVFEVLSPSTKSRDRDFKTKRYLGLGVKEVWLIDRVGETVEVVDLEGLRSATNERPLRSATVDGFALAPGDLFV